MNVYPHNQPRFKILPFCGSDLAWISIEETLCEENSELLASRIANQIYDLRKLRDFKGENVVIRDGLNAPSKLSESRIRKIFHQVKERIGCNNVQFLTCKKNRVLNIELWNDAHESLPTLPLLAQTYLGHLIADPHVVYKMNGDDIFQLPSGVESSIFYRVGNIQKDISVLDDIFILLFSYLKTCKTIIAETWSISTICYHAAKRISKICGRDEPNVVFLSNYYDDSGEPELELNDILTKAVLGEQTPVTLMFSATMSGLSWKRIHQRIRPHLTRARDFKAISLLKIGDEAAVPALCKLTASEPPVKGSNNWSVTINSKTYFPNFVNPEKVPILKHIGTYKPFFERYASKNVFKVHANSHSLKSFPSRHNAFYVSCEEIVKAGEFASRLKERIKDLSPPKTMIFLDTQSNSAIADLIDDQFDTASFKIVGARFEELEEAIADIGSDQIVDPIWIVDSVAVTGTTLGLFAKLVRDHMPGKNVSFVVGLDRPDSADKLKKRSQNLKHVTDGGGCYIAVEEVVLPDWGPDKCPWCQELRLLGSIENTGNDDADSPRNNRKSALFSSEGLVHDAYLTDPVRAKASVIELGPRSLFLDTNVIVDRVTQADIVCCVASVAQQWRTASKSAPFKVAASDESGQVIPLSTVSGPTTFNDPIIRAAIWRVFSLTEILPALRDELEEFERQFTEIVSAKSSDVLNPLTLEGAILLKGRLSRLGITHANHEPFETHLITAFRALS